MFAGVGAVGRIGRHGINGGAKRPSFSVDFVGSGSLGPGAVFTRASTGTYYNSSGVLVSAAINAPRFDYDPQTLQLKGLLLEDASTNIALQSGNLSVAPWALLNFTVAAPVVTGNNTPSPDGTVTAARIVYPAVSAAANGSVFYQSFTATAAPYTISLYLKGNVGGEQLYIAVQDGASTWYRVRATLTTQWQRFAVTTSSLTAALWYLEIGTDLRDGGQTSTSAQTVYAWGAQVEALPYMSSHIPTTSVSVTRARDDLTYPAAALTGFASPGGSWFGEFINANPAINGASMRIISDPGNSSGVGPMFIMISPAYTFGQYDGAAMNTANVVTLNTISKGVTTWAAGAAKACLNSGAVVSSAGLATGYAAIATTGVRIGTNSLAGAGLSGWMRATKYWPRTLSDSEMQAATTLAGPTLSLDFMQPGTLDPRITFTRASSATYTDASGVIQTAANNAPRWDYAGGVLRGLLIEEQRANLLLMSGDLSHGVWNTDGAGVAAPIKTGNVVVAPDGTVTATRLQYPSVSVAPNDSICFQFATLTATSYTWSVWLRGNAGGEQTYISVFGGAAITSPRLTLTTTWQRYTLTFTGTATTYGMSVGTDLRTAGQTATPAQTIYAWGAQIEQGAFPTSYIPTTSVSVTRAADVASISPANMTPWYASPGGSWMAEFIDLNSASSFTPRIISDPSAGSVYALALFTGLQAIQYDGPGAISTSNAIAANTVAKAVSTWAVGAAKICLNAGPVNSSAALTSGFPSFVSAGVRFGANNTAGDGMSGYIRRVTYWNRALSDTEMQQVTT